MGKDNSGKGLNMAYHREPAKVSLPGFEPETQKFLELLRVAATCAVVLLHSITGIMDTTDMSAYPAQGRWFLALLDMLTWCVPVFIMISGYLFLDPRRELTFRKMLTRYVRRIVLALFCFGVPYALLELIAGEESFRLWMLWKAVWMVCSGKSWAHMWYLYRIIFLYLITPALKWVLHRIPRFWVYLIEGILFAGSSLLPFLVSLWQIPGVPVLSSEVIYLFYYIYGYLLVSETKERKLKPWEVAGILILLAGMAASRLVGHFDMWTAYNYPFTVAVSVLLFRAAAGTEAWLRKRNTAPFTRLTGLCFTVYLIHPVFINFLYKYLQVSLLDFPLWISIPAFFAGFLILSVLSALFLQRIAPLRRYVL